MSLEGLHESVLLHESVQALLGNHGGTYVDATFGRGGHSRAIFQQSGGSARIVAFDRDISAIKHGAALLASGEVSVLVHSAFSNMASELSRRGISSVDGVLMDIGVSSPQLDTADRGFSFRLNGPLDMRMDQTRGQSAKEWINETDVSSMARVFRRLGEEPNALKIAKRIARIRDEAPIETTKQLASIVAECVPPSRSRIHPATRVFQAIRMEVNRELEELEAGLEQGWQILKQGGRLAVISFHSLEDRTVKRFMRQRIQPNQGDRPWAAEELPSEARAVVFPAKPTEQETRNNPRARSARLRVVEKL